MKEIDYKKIITIEAGKRSGKPCIRGMRITVYDIIRHLSSGLTYDELIENFPEITKEDILACFAYIADLENKYKVA